MLKYPLLRKDELKKHLAEKYGIVKNIDGVLKKETLLRTIPIQSKNKRIPDNLYQDLKYNPGEPDLYDIALSLRKNSYLTGFKLLSLYEWTEHIPRIIHVNWIKGYKKKKTSPTLDNNTVQKIAFKPKRKSNLKIYYSDNEIVLLNGQLFPADYEHLFLKPTKNSVLPEYSRIFIPEKLFLDAIVNYHYYGGADVVWTSLRENIDQINIDKLLNIYKKMDYIYPYGNAIGYILESAGTEECYLNQWRENVNRDIQFHLFMGDKERRIWNNKWNLYIPRRFSK